MKIRVGEFAASSRFLSQELEGRAAPREKGKIGSLPGVGRALSALLGASGLAKASEEEKRLARSCARAIEDIEGMGEIGEIAKGMELRINLASPAAERISRAVERILLEMQLEILDPLDKAKRMGIPGAERAKAGLLKSLDERIKEARRSDAAAGFLEMRPQNRASMEGAERTPEPGKIYLGLEEYASPGGSKKVPATLSRELGAEKGMRLVLLHELAHYLSIESRSERGMERVSKALLGEGAELPEEEKGALKGLGSMFLGGKGYGEKEIRLLKEAGADDAGWTQLMDLVTLKGECVADALAAMMSRNLSMRRPGEYPSLEEALEGLRKAREAETKDLCEEKGTLSDHATSHALEALPKAVAELPRDREWGLDEMIEAADKAAAPALARAMLAGDALGGSFGSHLMKSCRALARLKGTGESAELSSPQEMARTMMAFQKGLEKVAGCEWVEELQMAKASGRAIGPKAQGKMLAAALTRLRGWGGEAKPGGEPGSSPESFAAPMPDLLAMSGYGGGGGISSRLSGFRERKKGPLDAIASSERKGPVVRR